MQLLAMQIVGAFTPNSAAAERVFSLLIKSMFGDQQMTTLADYIQAALWGCVLVVVCMAYLVRHICSNQSVSVRHILT